MQKNSRMGTVFAIAIIVTCQHFTSVRAQDADELRASHETEVLGDGLYAFRYGLRRSYFILSAQGVIVVDPMSAEAAKVMRREIANISRQPVKYVAYSNSLFHRSAGGQIFKDEGAEFVAHEACAAELEATPNADVVKPDITFDDSYEISVGGQTLSLHGLGRSYGDCYTALVVKPANVILLPDLVTPPRANLPPDPTIANYYIYRIVPVFEKIEALAAEQRVTRVAGGDVALGEKDKLLATTAPVSLIAEQRSFWEILIGAVEAEAEKGTPARAIGNQLDMTAFDDFAGYDPRAIEIMTRRVYSLYRIGR